MPVSLVRFRQGVVLPTRVYLDTNLILHSRDIESRKYRAASLCLGELIDQQVELNVSTLVFDELWWGLFKQSYRSLMSLELTAQEYKQNSEIWEWNWPTIRRITDEILDWRGLNILESASSAELVHSARDLIDANPLAPRDAFHLAVVLRHGIPAFVTADSDFDAVRLPEGRSLTIVKF